MIANVFSSLTKVTPDTLDRGDGWRSHAACRNEDPELFFPRGEGTPNTEQIDEAKAICRACPVLAACRRWALTTGQDHGVWGGLSESERRRVLRRLAEDPGMTHEQAIRLLRSSQTEPKPLPEMFAERIQVDAHGHTTWLLKHTTISVNGRNRTPKQVAFILGYGREPEGRIQATCGVDRCLTHTHIADGQMRRERDTTAGAAA